MFHKHLKIFATTALLAGSSVALALPFNSFDPRSMGMGGAGVAVGDAGMAPFFNPALLTVTREEDDFSLILPVVGARAYDPSDFTTSLDNFQNGNYVNNLDASIQTFNATPSSANASVVANNTSALSTQLTTLSDKPIQAELGAGMVVGIPSKSFGGAFYANAWAAVGGVINYRDDQTLQAFAADANAVAACNNNPTCLAGLPPSPYFNPVTGQITFNSNNLQSSVDIRGVGVAEIGLAMSHEFGTEMTWGFGITPKLVKVNLFDYAENVNSSNTGNVTNSDYTAEYSHVNFDLGLAKDYGNGWRTGLVVKNIIPHKYEFKRIAPGAAPGSAKITTGEIELKPQGRIGISHTTSWSTVAMDVDLTTNDPAGFENKSQYLSLGAELNAWDWAQLRLGYRANLKDNKRNIPSIGLGLAPFGVMHLDIAAAANSNEVGASAMLSFTF
jgi:hypothetical protein